MNRRNFIQTLAGAAALNAMPPVFAQPNAAKPNIVFILIDDLGWGDFSCYGSKFHETPNIDALAREGVKFTHAYAGSSVCSPSRGAILTGQAPARSHLTQWIPGNKKQNKPLIEPQTELHLRKGIPTIASELKKVGYKTGIVGKWHLGDGEYMPSSFGFDVDYGGDNHGHPSWPSHYFGPFPTPGLEGYGKDDYLTEVLEQKAEAFIDSAKKDNKPFFLYYAHYAVHLPLGAREKMIEKYRAKNGNQDEPDPTYAAMIESVDNTVGKLRAKLKSLGMDKDTIIVLTSDNGGVGFQGRNLHRVTDNGGLHGGKGYLYEGGIREPLIVYWPGVTKAGTVSEVPVIGMDFFPTLLRMGGVTAPTNDGADLTPLLHGGAAPDRKTLFWHYPHYSDQGATPTGAMLQGDWRLIEFFDNGHVELYNLRLDPGEQYDFASSFSGRAQAMLKELKAWQKSVNAAMPTPATAHTQSLQKEGRAGCSWDPSPGCLED